MAGKLREKIDSKIQISTKKTTTRQTEMRKKKLKKSIVYEVI